MTKRMNRCSVLILAAAMLLTCIAFASPVNAASKADLKKANVKWDLKNNKTLKYKSAWTAIGVKKHTVKMTKFKVKDAETEGYKQCSFTLTFNRKINPNKSQVKKMGAKMDRIGTFGGNMYFTVADYTTGKSLEAEDNDKDVKVTSSWKYTKWKKFKGKGGSWISYARKTTVKVTITYPEDYKDLAIGVGGYPTVFSTDILDPYWSGEKSFSSTKKMYSKKDKSFAHFMRVK